MRRAWLLILSITVAAFAGAPTALAATRYVTITGSDYTGGFCGDPAKPCGTIQHAMDAANGGDVVQVGPGHYAQSVMSTRGGITVQGAGAGTLGTFDPTKDTEIDASGLGSSAVHFSDGATLRGLRLVGGRASTGGGHYEVLPAMTMQWISASVPYDLEGVVVLQRNAAAGDTVDPALTVDPGVPLTVGASTIKATGVAIDEAPSHTAPLTITGSVVTGGLGYPGVVATGGPVTITGSSLSGTTGAQLTTTSATITASSLRGTAHGLQFTVPGGGVGTFKARDSVFAASGGGAVDAMTLSRGTGLLSASLVGDTAVAAGSTATAALTANGGLVSAVNTLLRATGGSGQHDIVAAGANVTADHSSFTTTQATLGGQVPNPAAGGNIAGDPGLVSPAAPDSGLQAASPLHDRGDPAAVTAGETDREGYMRALDYDCDGVAQPDIGAFESPAPSVCPSAPPGSDPSPPGAGAGGSVPGAGGSVPGAGGPVPVPGGLDTIPPKLTRVALAHRGFTARRGTQLRFTLSEPARLRIAMTRIAGHKRRPAGTVAVALQAAGRRHVRLMGRIGRRSLGPGRYRARIVAIDAAGNRSAPVSLGFTIAAK